MGQQLISPGKGTPQAEKLCRKEPGLGLSDGVCSEEEGESRQDSGGWSEGQKGFQAAVAPWQVPAMGARRAGQVQGLAAYSRCCRSRLEIVGPRQNCTHSPIPQRTFQKCKGG